MCQYTCSVNKLSCSLYSDFKVVELDRANACDMEQYVFCG